MTTNILLGFPFGILSILCHIYLLIFDTRQSFRYYNLSLLLWVTANFLWMTTEFTSIVPSSNIHIGPTVPIGGVPTDVEQRITESKNVLFMIAIVIQFFLYTGVYFNKIVIPEEENEDQITKNEAALLCMCGRRKSTYVKPVESDSIVDIVDGFSLSMASGSQENQINNSNVSIAYIENAYIIFWILKDLFWSIGTGDFSVQGTTTAILIEIFAIFCGLCAIIIYFMVSYLNRRNSISILDCISTIFWIMANFVWMCGEFFLRYQNLKNDDSNEGNDSLTRIISCPLFLSGIFIQMFIIHRLYCGLCVRLCKSSNPQAIDTSSQPNADSLDIEMTSVSSSSVSTSPSASKQNKPKMIHFFSAPNVVKYQHVMVTFSPQHKHKHVDDDEESTILF